MVIMFLVSTFVYSGVVSTSEKALTMHERKIETGLQKYRNRDPSNPPLGFQKPITEETIKEIRSEILLLLGVVNGTILVIAGGLSYILAGITLKPIQKMMCKQEKFVSDAAHELKTPLTAMKTSLEVNLRSKKLTLKKAKEIITETIQDIDKLTNLTNYLLKESMYKQSNMENTKKINLNVLAKDVIGKMKASANEKKINITLEAKEKVTIIGNEQAIEELITILLDNAIKFNRKKGKAEVLIENRGSDVILQVTDNGKGISEEDLPFIFDRFYKAEKSRTKEDNEGFGLGLAIAKEIVKSHKGTIKAISKNTEDSLTTFTVKLPKK